MSLPTLALASAAALASSAYINAKFSIGIDLQNMRYEREWVQRLGERVKALGDTCTLWAMFDAVDESNEVLWFEGRSWTYGELKGGELL